MPYIIGNEGAERFSFYGMRTILIMFMTQYLVNKSGVLEGMPQNEAQGGSTNLFRRFTGCR